MQDMLIFVYFISASIRAVKISLFADYTDTECQWNQWFKQPIPIMWPIMTPIMRSRLKADVLTKIRPKLPI